jgi:hypothetical protein
MNLAAFGAPLPPRSLHLLFRRLCSQRPLLPQSLHWTVLAKAAAATVFALDCARKGRCRHSLYIGSFGDRACNAACRARRRPGNLCSNSSRDCARRCRTQCQPCSDSSCAFARRSRRLCTRCSEHSRARARSIFRVQLPFRKRLARGSAAAEAAVAQHYARKATPAAHLFALKAPW